MSRFALYWSAATASCLGVGGFYSILVLFAQRELSLRPSGYGLLLAVSAAGSVPAGMVADKVASGRHRRWVLALAAPATFTCLAAIAALPNLVLTAAARDARRLPPAGVGRADPR
jgi:hypothetical protein